jgi:outer membrane protein OmpA-like peptidoglycan-associated protein
MGDDAPTIQPIQKPAVPAKPATPRKPALATDTKWEDAIVRAVYDGVRDINKLVQIGVDAGGLSTEAVRLSAVKSLRIPLPKPEQAGGIEGTRRENVPARSKPDDPKVIFTGRYWSEKDNGERCFWAINQAGNAVIAVRTLRHEGQQNIQPHSRYRKLRGDVQPDGTAVLFDANEPEKFWGFLESNQQERNIVRWRFGSYLGADRRRVKLNREEGQDEVLTNPDEPERRPTLMESLWWVEDNELRFLLREHEWWPLAKEAYQFLEDGASSELLKDLVENFLDKPENNAAEKEARDEAAGRIVNYIGWLLWDGDHKTEPYDVTVPPELKQPHEVAAQKYVRWAKRLRGHTTNGVLATHVAKMLLSRLKIDRGSLKRSRLDLLIEIAKNRSTKGHPGETHARKLEQLLRIELKALGTAGIYRYHLKLEMVRIGFYMEGILTVKKTTGKGWSEPYDVYSFSKPTWPTKDTIFDVEVETNEEWVPDDFEGKLILGEVGFGLKYSGGFLISKRTGRVLPIEEGFSFDPGSIDVQQSKGKAKPRPGWDVIVGKVSRRHPYNKTDVSTPYPSDKNVIGDLSKPFHFYFDSAVLTPAGRQLLRVVCADYLAALTDPDAKIMLVGHTDQPNPPRKPQYNPSLSELRAKNVKLAIKDLFVPPGGILGVDPDKDIRTLGLGELQATLAEMLGLGRGKLGEHEKNPAYRRVDLIVDATLVATFGSP